MKRGIRTPLRYRRISTGPSLERPRRTESRNPLICHNCGEAGHRSTSSRRAAVSCGNCGRLGHRQLFCMKTNAGPRLSVDSDQKLAGRRRQSVYVRTLYTDTARTTCVTALR